MDRISPNFIYAFILTRSRFGLLHIIFCTIVPELWPLIYASFVSAQYFNVQCSPFRTQIKHGHILANIFTKEFYKDMISK